MPYIQPKLDVWIVDLDGTLADHKGVRGPYEEDKVKMDKPIEPVFEIIRLLIEKQKVIFLSGRTQACKEDTILWLCKWLYKQPHYASSIEIYMREIGDKRKDSIVKKEIYDNFIAPNYNVIGAFDDRDQVCQMWIENDIFLFNVSQGKGDF